MPFKNKIFTPIIIIVCTLFFGIQCSKEKITDNSYFGSKLIILGHRGMGMYYKFPGNTYQSIKPALEIGLDGCELDVQITRDTVLVFFHDHLLNPRTTCYGRIYESYWTDIKNCKYYAVENNIYINSVDDLFGKIPNLNKYYFSFDCGKIDYEATDINEYEYQLLRAIKKICDKYNMNNNVFIEGTSTTLTKAKELNLTNKLFLFTNVDESGIEATLSNDFFGISTSLDGVNGDADLAHQKGLYIMLWAPNNYSQNLDAINKNIDILQTDDPISILKLFNRFNYEYVIP